MSLTGTTLDKSTVNKLIASAIKAQQMAYAPYSKFRVGAALLTADGQVITGCNVENSAYGLCNCAERTAIFKAVSEGQRAFRAIAIVGDSDAPCAPCGACRQVMVEFAPQMQVIMANPKGEFEAMTAAELLPKFFKL
ncbi:MAG: cytidine deaminase [Clostridia bacterium]|nr:cytidine deaminase [Clostridia bacterium]